MQFIAALVLVAALIADPGCQPKNEEVELVEPSIVINNDQPTAPGPTSTKINSGTMTLSNTSVADTPVNPHSQSQTSHAVGDTPIQNASVASDAIAASTNKPTPPAPTTDSMDSLIQRDPLAAFKRLHAEAQTNISEYTCTFVKQERIGNTIGKEQSVEAKFRAEPYSVYFDFVKNPGLAGKVIYIKDKWVNEDASDPELRQLAAVRPAGLAGVIGVLKQPIRSNMAKKSGRRFIDQFGFERGLELLVRYSQQAADEGTLTLDYQGKGEFKGRPVWLIKRLLPYTDDNGVYPDRLALIYIDQEWGVPIAIHTFRTEEPIPEELLGKYEYTDLDFDPNLSDKDFDPDSI